MASNLGFTTKGMDADKRRKLYTKMGVDPKFDYTYSHINGGTLVKEANEQTIFERGILTGDPVIQVRNGASISKPETIAISSRADHIAEVTQQAALLQKYAMPMSV